MDYQDLDSNSKKIYESAVDDALQPLVDHKIIQRVPNTERHLFSTGVNIKKLLIAVNKGLQNQGKDPNHVIINGSKVLLSVLPFLLFRNDVNEKENHLLDEYIKDLLKPSRR